MEGVLQAFDPIVTPTSKVLILGSMPGEESLKKRQYYGHPQNAFWYIIAAVAGLAAPPASYERRINLLKEHDIALWDVCDKCTREGSLDSDIRKVQPHDVTGLLKTHPSIRLVLFNGQTPQKLYTRPCKPVAGVKYVLMPATSPAYARMPRADKVAAWTKQMSGPAP